MRKIRIAAPFRVQTVARFPGAVVWSPDNQRADRIQEFLEFTRSQGGSQRRIRRAARILADAATWVQGTEAGWAGLTLADWGRYLVQGASGLRLTDAPHLFPIVDTLHEFYAFWWWIDPSFLPGQPWPQKRRDRQRWVQHGLSYHVHREDFPEDLPEPLPF